MNDDSLRIETYTVAAGTVVIRVVGDFCGEGAAAVRLTLAGQLTGSPEVLIVDLSEIARIDAVGIDTLHSAAELAAEEDIGLGLVASPEGAVRAALDEADSTDAFEIFSSVSDALEDLP